MGDAELQEGAISRKCTCIRSHSGERCPSVLAPVHDSLLRGEAAAGEGKTTGCSPTEPTGPFCSSQPSRRILTSEETKEDLVDGLG